MLMIHHSCDMWSRGEWDPHSSSSFLINFSIKWKSWRTFIANYKNSMTHTLTRQYASAVLSGINIQNLQFFRRDILIRHLWNKSIVLIQQSINTNSESDTAILYTLKMLEKTFYRFLPLIILQLIRTSTVSASKCEPAFVDNAIEMVQVRKFRSPG